MATFGQTSISGMAGTDQDTGIIVTNAPCSPEFDGKADSISLYCDQWSIATGNMRFALYDSGKNLIAQTEEIPITTSEGWHTADFTSPPDILSSESYYICIWFAPAKMTIWDKAQEGANSCLKVQAYDGGNYPTPTIAWDFEEGDFIYAIFCTYTPSNGPPPPAPSANPLIGKPLISPDMIKKAKIR